MSPSFSILVPTAPAGAPRLCSAPPRRPWRARAAEAVLEGKVIDAALAAEAGRAALEGATPLSGNGYKAPMFEALVKRAILAAAAA